MKIYKKMRDSVRYENERKTKKDQINSRIRMSVPFPGENLGHKLRRIGRKYNIEVVFKSTNKISDRLVRLKEPMRDEEKSGVVYRVPLNCDKEYIDSYMAGLAYLIY